MLVELGESNQQKLWKSWVLLEGNDGNTKYKELGAELFETEPWGTGETVMNARRPLQRGPVSIQEANAVKRVLKAGCRTSPNSIEVG